MWKQKLKLASLNVLLAFGVNLTSMGFGAAAVEYINPEAFQLLGFGLWCLTTGLLFTILYVGFCTFSGD